MRNRWKTLPVIAVLLLSALLFPLSASAEVVIPTEIYATSLEEATPYFSIEAAWKAAKSGKVIILTKDWVISERLETEEKNYVQIYMNGHTISRNCSEQDDEGQIFYLEDESRLILYGCGKDGQKIQKNFTVDGCTTTEKKERVTLSGGGLITGGWADEGGAAYLEKKARLTLSNVVVAGNRAEEGGAIYLNGKNGSVALNRATVAYNAAVEGGAIYLYQENGQIDVALGSKIDHNYASQRGGAIYAEDALESIYLTNHSTINYNTAGWEGGAFYSYYDGLTIKSSDKTGSISYNKAIGTLAKMGNGGAISLDYNNQRDNENVLYGLTLDGNSSGDYGGAISNRADNDLTVQSCVIRNNTAVKCGGGIYNYQSRLKAVDCTITGNTAGWEGGGIFENFAWNMTLQSQVIIKNNHRTDGSADDLYLDYEGLGGVKALLVQSLLQSGSEIGIRTDTDEDRQIGKNTNTFHEEMFFSDVAGFAVETASNDTELYLRKRNGDDLHSVTVNGKVQGYYKTGAKFTIDGTPENEDQVFVEWTGEALDLTFLDSTKNSVATVESMPKSDLKFTSIVATPISSVKLTVGNPQPGKPLATTAALAGTDLNGDEIDIPVSEIYWLTQDEQGKLKTVTGNAEYGTSYCVAVNVPENLSGQILFADEVTGSIQYRPSGTSDTPNKIYVDEEGTLFLYGNLYTTPKAEIKSVDGASLTVKSGTTEADLRTSLPTEAVVRDADGNLYTVDTDPTKADLTSVLTAEGKVQAGEGEVTVPLKLNGSEKVENGQGENEKKLTVTLTVTEEPVKPAANAPTADLTGGTYREKAEGSENVSVTVKLTSSDENTTITYSLNGEPEQSYDSDTGIVLTAQPGEKKTYNLLAYASGDNYQKSAGTALTYVLENPYTVTVEKTCGESSLGEAYKAEYYKGDAVTVGAPVVEGYTFAKWENIAEGGVTIPEEQLSDNAFAVASLSGNIRVKATYTKNEEKQDPEPEPEQKTKYYFKIVYAVKDSDPRQEIGFTEGTAEAGAKASEALEVAQTVKGEDGLTYEFSAMDGECIVTETKENNVFYALYVVQKADPGDEESEEDEKKEAEKKEEEKKKKEEEQKKDETPSASPSETPKETSKGETPTETPAPITTPEATVTPAPTASPEATATAGTDPWESPKTGDGTPLAILSLLLVLSLLFCTGIVRRRRG